MITWTEVRRLFEASGCTVVCEKDVLREFWSTRFLSRGEQADSALCLYFVFAREIGEVTICEGVSLVIVGMPDEYELSLLEASSNCLYVSERYESFAAYSSITGVLSEQYYVGYLMFQLHDHVYHNRGMQRIVDEIASFFKLPVSVLDTSFRFIARSQLYIEESGDDRVRLEPDSEEISDEVLMVLESYGALDRVLTATEPVHVKVRDSAWFVPIYVNHSKAAYLTIYEQEGAPDSPLKDRYVYALPLIAEALSNEIGKDSFYLYNKASYFTYIFGLMLERENVDTDDIRSRLRIFGYDLRPQLYVLCLELPYGASSGLTHASLADALKNTFRNSIYVTRDRELVFLVSRSERDLVGEAELVRWQRALRSAGVLAGFSGPFEGVEAVRRHLTLAEQALAVGWRRHAQPVSDPSNLFRFEECQVDALLSTMDAGDLSDYRFGPLIDLCSYDEEHHTDLVQTLCVYLENPRDVNGICDKLCIHKNTLYKRLDRIRVVMGTDFVSAETIMRIQFTLHIMGIAG